MNRAFSADGLHLWFFLGRCPRLRMDAAPLARLTRTPRGVPTKIPNGLPLQSQI
jgi:hypothetical protein